MSTKLEKQVYFIRNGSIRSHVAQQIAELEARTKKPFRVVIDEAAPKRSDLQNAYMWGWLYKNIIEQLTDAGIEIECDDGDRYPWTDEILHACCADMFLIKAELRLGDHVRKLYWSTTELRKHPHSDPTKAPSFGSYVKQVQTFVWNRWGITIPPTFSEDLQGLQQEVQNAA